MIRNVSPLEVSTTSLVSVAAWRYNPKTVTKTESIQLLQKQQMKKNKTIKETGVTKLGEEKQEHDNGGSESDNTAGKRARIEIFVDFRIRIEIPKLAHYAIHAWMIIVFVDSEFRNEDPNQRSKPNFVDYDLYLIWWLLMIVLLELKKHPVQSKLVFALLVEL